MWDFIGGFSLVIFFAFLVLAIIKTKKAENGMKMWIFATGFFVLEITSLYFAGRI
jgi:hypothetical protein